MSSHFPESEKTAELSAQISNCKNSGSSLSPKKNSSCINSALKHSFITENMVKNAILSFSPLKCPGPDKIKPICLQQAIMNSNFLTRLTTLYRACIKLNNTPRPWRESNVIFIPKPSRDDYSNVRSFRPISLLSFFFKTLETVVMWRLESTSMKAFPLSMHQHAFRKGKSCESIISDLVDDIESSLLQGEQCLVVNLDIQAAFDYLNNYSIIKAMRERNFSINIIGWY